MWTGKSTWQDTDWKPNWLEETQNETMAQEAERVVFWSGGRQFDPCSREHIKPPVVNLLNLDLSPKSAASQYIYTVESSYYYDSSWPFKRTPVTVAVKEQGKGINSMTEVCTPLQRVVWGASIYQVINQVGSYWQTGSMGKGSGHCINCDFSLVHKSTLTSALTI